MPTLSSLLVQREVLAMRTVEEAIARQVLHGGDLATNLLELASVDEAALLPILAECAGLLPARAGSLPSPSAAALRVVPGELALRHGFFPLELDGRVLVIATADPLPRPVEEDLGFALDVELRQLAAPIVRIRQAIAQHYGIPLDRRFMRLVAKLEGRPDPNPSSIPPAYRGPGPMHLPRPASVPPPTFGTGLLPRHSPLAPRLVAKTPLVAPATPAPAIPPIPPYPALALDALTPFPMRAVKPPSSAPPAPRPDPPPQAKTVEFAYAANKTVEFAYEAPPEGALEGPPTEPATALHTPTPSAPVRNKRAMAGWLKRTATEERTPIPGRERRRGPFTAVMAERALEAADGRDAILDVYFDFALQFFEYTALFTVQGDIAEGRDAFGPGADREKVAGIGVPLDLPSTLLLARDRKAPLMVRFASEGLDAELLRDLGRSSKNAALSRAVIPVVVRNRCVSMLYGDDGTRSVELASIGDLIGFTGLVSTAFERMILKKKLGGFKGAEIGLPKARLVVPPALPKSDPGAARAALARALELGTPGPSPAGAGALEVPTQGALPAGAGALPLAPAGELEFGTPGAPLAVVAVAGAPERTHPIDATAPQRTPVAPQISPGAESVRAPGLLPAASLTFSDLGTPGPPPSPAPVARESGETIYDVIARAAESSSPTTLSFTPVDPFHAAEISRVLDKSRGLDEAELLDAGWGAAPEAPPTVLVEQRTPADPPLAERPLVHRRRAAPGLGVRTKTAMSEPLPATPPPNAISSHPDGGSARTHTPPIPREETPETLAERSPGVSAFVAAMDATPASEQAPPSTVARASDRASASGLPTVIVDVEAEYGALLQAVADGGVNGDLAFADLVKHAEQSMPSVMARFPGPLRVDRHRARDQLPAASQCGPILEVIVAARRIALPFVTVRSSSQDPEIRFWATHVLGELRYPEAANAMVPRLFDEDAAVRRIARRSAAALVNAGPAGKPILQGLDHLTRNADEPIERRVLAIETMGEIRVGAMVPPLIAVLADPSDEVGDAARRALLLVTRQDFGRETRRWLEWWAKLGSRHRIEWLIDALMHESPAIRRAAGDELKQLTKEYFGYYDDLPKKERERAQARYREWWTREGHSRFH